MLVSDRKRFIFVHNPKTGGSSVRAALEKYDERDGFYWDHEDSALLGRVIDKAHIPIPDFATYPDGALLEKYFVFGFVRNPYDRVYSAFREKKKQWKLEDEITFNEFVQSELNEASIRYDWNLIHFCPQHYFFYANGKCKADYVGRYESLTRDFAHCVRLINIDVTIDLPRRNTSKNDESAGSPASECPTSLQHYDSASLNIVNRLYDKDFVYFGYEKYFPDGESDLGYYQNKHEDGVHSSLGFIKGAEQFYAARLESSAARLERAEHEAQSARRDYDALEQMHQDLLGSHSWRLTAPLRKLCTWFRGVLRA